MSGFKSLLRYHFFRYDLSEKEDRNESNFNNGCSSGIGLDTALSFRDAGWNVIASCRKQKDCKTMQTKHNMHSVLIDYANERKHNKGFTDALEYTASLMFYLIMGLMEFLH